MGLLDVLTSLFALVILILTVQSSNKMTSVTCHLTRASVVALSLAALGLVLKPFYPNDGDWPQIVFVLAVAVFLYADRRSRNSRGGKNGQTA